MLNYLEQRGDLTPAPSCEHCGGAMKGVRLTDTFVLLTCVACGQIRIAPERRQPRQNGRTSSFPVAD